MAPKIALRHRNKFQTFFHYYFNANNFERLFVRQESYAAIVLPRTKSNSTKINRLDSWQKNRHHSLNAAIVLCPITLHWVASGGTANTATRAHTIRSNFQFRNSRAIAELLLSFILFCGNESRSNTREEMRNFSVRNFNQIYFWAFKQSLSVYFVHRRHRQTPQVAFYYCEKWKQHQILCADCVMLCNVHESITFRNPLLSTRVAFFIRGNSVACSAASWFRQKCKYANYGFVC